MRAYPELYFAKVVVLGEGASEEVILPAISEAMGVPIDKSFVAMVPLGGRHGESHVAFANRFTDPLLLHYSIWIGGDMVVAGEGSRTQSPS